MFHRLLRTLPQTHMHVVGSSGYGKSKFLEWLLQQAYHERKGFCLIDWHGTLYSALLEFLAYLRTDRPVYLLNPSDSDFVAGYNPFHADGAQGGDEIAASVGRRLEATLKGWGAENADETPQLSEVLRHLYHFAAETGETIPAASLLLHPEHQRLRVYAADAIRDPHSRDTWKALFLAKQSDNQFQQLVASSRRRLDRLLAYPPVRRMLGVKSPKLDLSKIVEEDAILLVNLAPSRVLPTEAARLLAALLFNEFRELALKRAGTDKSYILCLDEFHEYLTHDVPAMLDESRKGGLSLILCHQRFGQLGRDEELSDALASEAQIKIVFGGLRYESAASLAQDMMLPTINSRQITETYHRLVTRHELQSVYSMSTTMSSGRTRATSASETESEHSSSETSGRSDSVSDAFGQTTSEQQMLMPYYEYEKSHDAERSREEKVSRAASSLMELRRRQCFVKLPQSPEARRFMVRVLQSFRLSPEDTRAYEAERYAKQGALSPAAADSILAADREAFIRRAQILPKKKPPTGSGSTPPKI